MINASRIVLLLFSFALNVYGGSLRLIDYVLPTYYGPANRALVQGSFVIDVTVNEGKTKKVTIVSHEVTGAGNRLLSNAPVEMKNGIINALSKWQFDQENPQEQITIRVRISFRLGDKETTGDRQGFVFSVREEEGRPAEITIEADRLKPKVP